MLVHALVRVGKNNFDFVLVEHVRPEVGPSRVLEARASVFEDVTQKIDVYFVEGDVWREGYV